MPSEAVRVRSDVARDEANATAWTTEEEPFVETPELKTLAEAAEAASSTDITTPANATDSTDVTKLTEATEATEATESAPPIDTALGLSYAGGIKGLYDPMLQMFSDLQPKKAANIAEAYAANDWPTYAIDVHALKSNALSIGAKHLSELAKSLELAAKTIGKDGATEEEKSEAEATIRAHHAELMELYEDVAGEAKKLLAASQE